MVQLKSETTIEHAQAFRELGVTERVFGPGHRQRRHEHERASVYLFLAGSSSEYYGTRDREYSESSVVVNPAGTRHAVRCGSAGVRIVNVEIGAAHLERLRPRGRILQRVEEI